MDMTLTCGWCRAPFIFTVGEQELLRLRGVPAAPTRCPTCVRTWGAPRVTPPPPR
jgi:hypothetical protein